MGNVLYSYVLNDIVGACKLFLDADFGVDCMFCDRVIISLDHFDGVTFSISVFGQENSPCASFPNDSAGFVGYPFNFYFQASFVHV